MHGIYIYTYNQRRLSCWEVSQHAVRARTHGRAVTVYACDMQYMYSCLGIVYQNTRRTDLVSRAKLRVMALKKLVLSIFYAGRVRLSENLLESIVLHCTVELLQTVHALARKTCYIENAYVCQLVFC